VQGANIPVASNISPIALQKGESVYAWGVLAAGATQLPVQDLNVIGEEPAAILPEASISVNLQAGSEGQPPPMVCIEIAFVNPPGLSPAAPGAFEIDIQEADTDADAAYILPTNSNYKITSVNAVTQRARVDLSPTGGKFLRLLLVSLTNDVDLIAKITRLA